MIDKENLEENETKKKNETIHKLFFFIVFVQIFIILDVEKKKLIKR